MHKISDFILHIKFHFGFSLKFIEFNFLIVSIRKVLVEKLLLMKDYWRFEKNA